MSFTWDKPPSRAWNMQLYRATVAKTVKSQFDYYAAQIEREMKLNASWIDRTGNARQTLAAFTVVIDDGRIVLVAKQQMDYGLWLEIANAGVYAIVLPTLQRYYGDVMNSLKRLLK